MKGPIKRSQPNLRPSNHKVLESYFAEINPLTSEPKILPPVLQQQHKRAESQAETDSPRHRLLVKKVSKVSILSTTRKIENSEVTTQEKLIPIYQNSLSTLSNTHKQLSANFLSNVQRELYPKKEHLPGPGEYNLLSQKENTRLSQSQNQNSLTNITNQVSFGSSKDRSIVYLNRDITCPFQDKTSAPDVGKYTRNDSKIPNKQPVKTTLAGGVDIHKPILRSEMAKNYIFAKQFYSSPSDGKLVPDEKPDDIIPGPGAYNPEYPSTIAGPQNTNEKRQKQSPFGSNDQRFKQVKNGVVTEQQLREMELQEDMYDHTKIRKKSPAERKSNLMKPVTKHYEKQVTVSGMSKQEEMVKEFVRLVEQHIPQPLKHQSSVKSIKQTKSVQPIKQVISIAKISEPQPGPGAYSLPRAKNNGLSFGKAPREQIFQQQNHYTGPADYQVLDTLERKSFNRRL